LFFAHLLNNFYNLSNHNKPTYPIVFNKHMSEHQQSCDIITTIYVIFLTK